MNKKPDKAESNEIPCVRLAHKGNRFITHEITFLARSAARNTGAAFLVPITSQIHRSSLRKYLSPARGSVSEKNVPIDEFERWLRVLDPEGACPSNKCDNIAEKSDKERFIYVSIQFHGNMFSDFEIADLKLIHARKSDQEWLVRFDVPVKPAQEWFLRTWMQTARNVTVSSPNDGPLVSLTLERIFKFVRFDGSVKVLSEPDNKLERKFEGLPKSNVTNGENQDQDEEELAEILRCMNYPDGTLPTTVFTTIFGDPKRK